MSTEARFRALVEHSADILSILEEDGRISYISPSVQITLGRAPDTLSGNPVFHLVHPEDITELRRAFEKSASTLEIRFRHQAGQWVYLETVITRYTDDPDIRGYLMNARDRTERHQAREALSASERKYRRLFEESRDAICIGTLEGRLLDINAAGIKLFEYSSKEEMLSLDIGRDLYWNPETRKKAETLFTSQGFLEDLELELKTRSGKRLRVRETASPVYDKSGTLVGFQAILRDVTEQRKTEEQLRQSQKMDAVGRLAGGVAHDFNNLLTAINGYSELALARMDSGNPLRTAVVEIRKAGKRAAELTRRLLTLSRHQMVARRRLNLNRVVLEIERLLQRVLGEDIVLATLLDPKVEEIRADQGQMEQLILNLGVNARDAMPQGGRLELETRAVTLPGDGHLLTEPADPVPGKYALLTVRDTGEGMNEEVREKLFEPFFTTKEQGHNSGLGLSIVYSIVMQNKGYIELDSDLGTGSIFHIYLPRMEDQAAIAEEQKIIDKMPGGQERVLLVEDEDAVRSLVKQVLVLLGYDVLEAADAIEAEMICDRLEGAPDLLLTDVVMPKKSGMALAEDLQKRYPEIKILFISGYTDSHTGVRLLTERRAAFLPKPFSPEVLARKVREVFDGQI
jgi:PAS domain S-box-containing protein